MTSGRMIEKRYFLLFAAQSIGAIILISQCIPIYSRLLSDAGNPQQFQFRMMALVAFSTVLMQSAYWYRLFNVPLPVHNTRVVIGHLVLFVGRLGFIVATSLFSIVLFRHLPEMDYARNWPTILSDGGLLGAMLFSIYCFKAELERIGVALRGQLGR